jgi:putative holliday junction resolvase
VAVSDPLGIIATPLTIISRQDVATDVRIIMGIVKKNDVGRIIVGLPFTMDGTLGIQAEKVSAFADELSLHIAIPLEYRDERLSTVAAKRILQRTRKTNRETRYDAAAAALILQGYLEDILPPREYQPDEEADTE